MSVAPNAGVVDLDTFLPPTGAADGVQGQVPKPLAGQAGYVLTGTGWASAGSVGLVGYQGTWNALTNTPTLTSSVGVQGYYYVVNIAGTTNLNGITDWQVGDWAIFNGSVWQKVDNTDSYDPANVAITGGTINNTTIGATTPSTGVFTTLTAQTEVLKGTGQNLVGYSQAFDDSSWTKSNSSITANSTTAPDGTTTADTLVENTANSTHYLYASANPALYATIVTGITYTSSIYVKPSGRNRIRFSGDGSSGFLGGDVIFDVLNGTVGSIPSGVTSASIVSAGNGWYRCIVVAVATGVVSRPIVFLDNGTTTTYTGDGASGVFVWGVQVEIGSTVNSYVATTPTKVYGTPTLSFSGVASIGLQSDGSLYETSAGTGNVRFYTNNIGQEQARVSHTASAINYVELTGAQIANAPTISSKGSDTNISFAYSSKGTGGHDFYTAGASFTRQFTVAHTASAVNFLQVAGGVSGDDPSLSSAGSQSRNIRYRSGSGASHLFETGTYANLQAAVSNTASAVNWVQVTGAITGGNPQLSVQGSDANPNFDIYAKGSGVVRMMPSVLLGRNSANYFRADGAAASSGPVFSVAGSDTNIDLNLTPKGTGNVVANVNSGTFTIGRDSASNAIKLTAPNQNLYVQSSGGGVILFNTSDGTTLNQMRITSTASVVNYLNVTGSATGSGVTLSAQGSDTNIDINLVPKGTGSTVYTGGVTINGTLTAQNEVLKGTGQNFFTYSQTFTNAIWLGTNTSATDNTTVAPNGTTTAATVTLSVSGANFFKQNVNVIAGTQYTFSFYALRGTATDMKYSVYNNSASAELVAATSYYSSTNGSTWSRITLTFTTPSGCTNVGVYPSRDSASTGTFFVWGAQVELGSTANTYIPTTATAVYGTPTLSFSGVSTIGLESNGSLFVQPAGTGALQAQATTSSATGGNARGANAVDWQTIRASALQVASGTYSVIAGGSSNRATGSYSVSSGGNNNTASGFISVLAGGNSSTASGTYSTIVGGISNTASIDYATVVGGQSNTAAGFYNFIGGGFTNSGTTGATVTSQSGTMNGTTAVTLSGSNASIKVGQYIFGTSIAADTYVSAISGTSLTLSKVASGSSTSTLSFFTPHGVVVGGGNNQATGSYSFIGGGGDAGTAANRNVASGDWSFVGGGQKNTASGVYSSVNGTNNTSSGTASVIAGGGAFSPQGFFGNSASGTSSFIGAGIGNLANSSYSAIVSGTLGTTRGIDANHVFPAINNAYGANATGVAQSALLVLAKQTTDATATVLVSNNSAVGTTNQVILPNNSAYFFTGEIISGVTGGGNSKGWTIEGVIKRGANAASTTLVGSTVTSLYADAGAATWAIALSADTTNGGLAVTFTGQAATTIRTVCQIRTTEMTY